MFSLARTPLASPATSTTIKHAVAASFPFPNTFINRSASTLTSPELGRRMTGPLFEPMLPHRYHHQYPGAMGTPSSPIHAPNPPLHRQAYGTAALFQNQSLLSPRMPNPHSTTFSTPKQPLKSCLKSPEVAKSPAINRKNTPRFHPSDLSIPPAGNRALPKESESLEETLRMMSLDTNVGVMDSTWRRCRDRLPTPYNEVVPLDSSAGSMEGVEMTL